MAVFEAQAFRDFIQNNIDYVAKQIGVVNDFLFGEASDGTDEIPQMPYVLHTCQLFAVNPSDYFDVVLSWTQYAVADVNLDSSGLHIRCFDALRSDYGGFPDRMEYVDSVVLPYLSSYSYDVSLADLGVDYIYNQSEFIKGVKDNGEVYPVYFDSVFNGVNGHQQLQLALYPKQTFSYRGDICDTWNVHSGFYSERFYFQQVDNTAFPSRMIIMPNPQSKNTWTFIDNSTVQTIDYNGHTIYNYYNDSGDIIINGGGGTLQAPIMPVGGLAYADVKFILDSLIDDLNLHFDFAADGVEPLAPAPTLEELRYIDQGSFYITPIKQIPVLPNAPDVADTSVDVSDYVALLGGSITELTSIFGSIGLDMMLVLTFLSCLVIRHLRR